MTAYTEFLERQIAIRDYEIDKVKRRLAVIEQHRAMHVGDLARAHAKAEKRCSSCVHRAEVAPGVGDCGEYAVPTEAHHGSKCDGWAPRLPEGESK